MKNYEKNDYVSVIDDLYDTLKKNNVEYNLDDFSCFKAITARKAGNSFGFSAHLSGAVFALLGSQRTWEGIKNNYNNLCDIFHQFDRELFEYTTVDSIIVQIKSIKCGNKNIKSQMEGLPSIIRTFSKIERDYGSLDNFILHDTPVNVATILIKSKEYKLRGLGPSLVFDYMRNVGIDIAKPDTHLMRLFGSERLGFFDTANSNQFDVIELIDKMAKAVNTSPAILGTTFWMLCSRGYGNICGATPQCEKCNFKNTICSFRKGTSNADN